METIYFSPEFSSYRSVSNHAGSSASERSVDTNDISWSKQGRLKALRASRAVNTPSAQPISHARLKRSPLRALSNSSIAAWNFSSAARERLFPVPRPGLQRQGDPRRGADVAITCYIGARFSSNGLLLL